MASIKKRDDGRYRARYRDHAGRERARHFNRKADAQSWLDEQTAALVRGEYIEPERGRETVGAWGAEWLDGRVDLKPKTAAGYLSLWETRIKPTWNRYQLANVTNADVQKWVADMSAEELSPSRIRQAYRVLSAMLADAVRDRRITSNPATGVRLPRMPRPKEVMCSHEQLVQVAEACGPYRSLVLTLGYCGLRWGEAAALRVGRVNLLRARLDIVESATEVNGRMVFGPPKTHQRRSVPIPASLREDLARQCEGKSADDLVWTSARGNVLRVNGFRRAHFDKAVTAAGLVDFTPHSLRHVCATLAIAAGATVKGAQALLGHADASTTLNRYAALWPDELDAVATKLDEASLDARRKISRTERGPKVVELRDRSA